LNPRPTDYEYNKYKNDFIKYLKGKNLSHGYLNDLLNAFSKMEIKLDKKYLNTMKDRNKQIVMRHYIEFLKTNDIISEEEANQLKGYLKLKQSKPDNFIPSDEIILNVDNNIKNDRVKIIYKILCYSGLRITEAVKFIREFDKTKLIINESFVRYPLNYNRGKKNSYYVYLPKEFGLSLHKMYIHEDTVTHYISKAGLNPKYLRKWFYNFLIFNNVPESVADYIEGRSPLSVGSMHYLGKTKQADYWYDKVVINLNKYFNDV